MQPCTIHSSSRFVHCFTKTIRQKSSNKRPISVQFVIKSLFLNCLLYYFNCSWENLQYLDEFLCVEYSKNVWENLGALKVLVNDGYWISSQQNTSGAVIESFPMRQLKYCLVKLAFIRHFEFIYNFHPDKRK